MVGDRPKSAIEEALFPLACTLQPWGGSMRKWRHFRAYRAKVVPGPDGPGLSCESRAPRAYRAKVAPEAKIQPSETLESPNFRRLAALAGQENMI